jgi:hypothetical protein
MIRGVVCPLQTTAAVARDAVDKPIIYTSDNLSAVPRGAAALYGAKS